MRLQIQLGRLVSACEAVPGVYHVQDQMTGALVPVAAPREQTWRDRWSPWHGTLTGVAVAFAAVAASGMWQWQQYKASSQTPAPGPSVALPIAITDPQSGSVRMIDAPYQDEGPLPITPQPPGDERAPSAPAMTIAAAPAPQFQPSTPPAVPAPAAAIIPAPAAARKAAPVAKRRPPVAAKLPTAAPSTKPTAAPSTKPIAPLPAKQAKQAKRATTAASDPAGADETVVVFNEPTHTRQSPAAAAAVAAAPARVAPTTPPQARQVAPAAPTAHATPASPSAPAAPAASAAPTPKAGGLVRLVAIKDANLALVHIPGNPLPIPVKTGAKLPNGLTLVKADPAKGVVHFDNGSTLALE